MYVREHAWNESFWWLYFSSSLWGSRVVSGRFNFECRQMYIYGEKKHNERKELFSEGKGAEVVTLDCGKFYSRHFRKQNSTPSRVALFWERQNQPELMWMLESLRFLPPDDRGRNNLLYFFIHEFRVGNPIRFKVEPTVKQTAPNLTQLPRRTCVNLTTKFNY